MKKFLTVSLVGVIFLMTAGTASAHWGGRYGFGVSIGPPIVVPAPPPPVYYRGYYPPPYYYGPGYYGPGYYGPSNRTWVPGRWEWRMGPYGWERAWIPGYWEYR
jgi:hypothetical protein